MKGAGVAVTLGLPAQSRQGGLACGCPSVSPGPSMMFHRRQEGNIGAKPDSRLQVSNPLPLSWHQSRTKGGLGTCSLLGWRDQEGGLWHPQLMLSL